MLLSDVNINNFKSLKDIKIKLNPKLNLLIGENNSGKSNFAESLIFLKEHLVQNAIFRQDHPGPTEDYERKWYLLWNKEFDNKVYNKNTNKSINYNLSFLLSDDEKDTLISSLSLGEDETRKFKSILGQKIEYIITFDKKTLIEEQIAIYLNGKRTEFAKKTSDVESKNRENYKYYVINKFDSLDNLAIEAAQPPYGSINQKSSILKFAKNRNYILKGDYLLKLIMEYFENICYLKPYRLASETKNFVGDFNLKEDGSNLPEVLASINLSDRKCFDKIESDIKNIIDNISNIAVQTVPNSQSIYITIEEEPLREVKYTWDNISSGTKEIMFLVTLLNSSRRGSLIIMEEPEICLNTKAIKKFIKTLDDIVENKQIIITTHSPIFVDSTLEKALFCVKKERGVTKISLAPEHQLERYLLDAGLSKSDLFVLQPSLLVIVEGRDDRLILKEFLRKDKINVPRDKINIVNIPQEKSGESRAIEFGETLKKTGISIPLLIILDSDGEAKRESKIKNMRQKGFKDEEYYILKEKEIESYLIDANAISRVTGRSLEEVNQAIEKMPGNGKSKLQNIFKNLDSELGGGDKEKIAANLSEIPKDIKEIIDKMKVSLT